MASRSLGSGSGGWPSLEAPTYERGVDAVGRVVLTPGAKNPVPERPR